MVRLLFFQITVLLVTSEREIETRHCAERSKQPGQFNRRGNPVRLITMKNINWKNIAVIAVVSLVTVVFVWPFLKPYAQKIPLIGSKIS